MSVDSDALRDESIATLVMVKGHYLTNGMEGKLIAPRAIESRVIKD